MTSSASFTQLPRRRHYIIATIVGLLLLTALVFTVRYRLPTLGYYWLTQTPPTSPQPTIWLPDYTATIDAKTIRGIDDDLSGITYHPATDTLFAITNQPGFLLELDRHGNLLRQLPINGVSDVEDITVIRPFTFLLIDEGHNSAHVITVDSHSEAITPQHSFALGLTAAIRNKGAEGIFWDAPSQHLFVAQERNPARVFKVALSADEILNTDSNNAANVAIKQRDEIMRFGQLLSPYFLRDISAIAIDPATGNRLLLSDDSHAIAEYSATGELLSVLPLWRGIQGLARSIPQAEGIALSPQGDIFIVSEPNLFYRYEKSPTS